VDNLDNERFLFASMLVNKKPALISTPMEEP